MADASPDALLVVDEGGIIQQTGGEIVRLLGRSAEDLLGASITRVLDRPSAERLLRRLDDMTSGSTDESVLVLERLVCSDRMALDCPPRRCWFPWRRPRPACGRCW